MNIKIVAPVLLSLGLSASAHALGPIKVIIQTPMTLPGAPVPVIAPTRLPSPATPLATPMLMVTATPMLSESIFDWSWLSRKDDGPDAAGALVLAGPGPKPLAPVGAMKNLRAASENVETGFDGKIHHSRRLVLAD
ncbi:MAG: hypothetical protein HYZ74_00100 [Elusimicrobia bacterium]|nr:hypothetical protein [Elusimicrobiota bacterium]